MLTCITVMKYMSEPSDINFKNILLQHNDKHNKATNGLSQKLYGKAYLGLSPAPISASVRLPHRTMGESGRETERESGREGASTWSRASKG